MAIADRLAPDFVAQVYSGDVSVRTHNAHGADPKARGGGEGEATRMMGQFLREVVSLSAEARNFRSWGPDETASNRLDAVFDVNERVRKERIEPYDVHLAQEGRVMEILSEYLCQGWLEGYLLAGDTASSPAMRLCVHIVDSVFNQQAKWLKVSRGFCLRRPILPCGMSALLVR